LCTADEIELDQELGCLTFTQVEEVEIEELDADLVDDVEEEEDDDEEEWEEELDEDEEDDDDDDDKEEW
jgi:hypothetical protein